MDSAPFEPDFWKSQGKSPPLNMEASQEQIQMINETMAEYRQNIQKDTDYLHGLTDIRKRLDESRNKRASELRESLTRMRHVNFIILMDSLGMKRNLIMRTIIQKYF